MWVGFTGDEDFVSSHPGSHREAVLRGSPKVPSVSVFTGLDPPREEPQIGVGRSRPTHGDSSGMDRDPYTGDPGPSFICRRNEVDETSVSGDPTVVFSAFRRTSFSVSVQSYLRL